MRGKYYTFHVNCSFTLQYTFTEDEVERDPGGDESDFEPTDEALRNLERELEEYLGQNYAVYDLDASANSTSFRHTENDGA